MSRNRINAQDKNRIIDAYKDGRDYEEVADVLGIKRGTAYRIIRRYNLTGVVDRRKRGANNRRTDEEMANMAVAIVQEHPEYTLTINDELRLKLPDKPSVCENSVELASWTDDNAEDYTGCSHTTEYHQIHTFMDLAEFRKICSWWTDSVST